MSNPNIAGTRLWTVAVLIMCAPVLVALCATVWRAPYPISEAVALFEDVARFPPSHFVSGDTAYYRPLYHLTIGAIWRNAGTLDAKLTWIKLLHIVPIVLLVLLFIWHVRPRSALEAAAAAAATAVVLGSLGLRDNLEIPLSYTAVGMPLALAVWILSTHVRRAWTAPLVIVLTLVAIGFKEQGLVIVPLVVAAWWTRAPGASRGVAAMLVAVAATYVVFRVVGREQWAMFEQSVGYGFGEFSPAEAEARFGSFPYLIYAYSALSTIGNVLFSEPNRGIFGITWMISQGQARPWEYLHLISSVALTAVIAWWAVGTLKQAARDGWTHESRTLVATAAVLLACGLLSFNYSRDRLGGMAVAFYALTAFFAMRSAAERALTASRSQLAAIGVTLMLIAAAWQIRAIGTVEYTRFVAARNHIEWLTQLPARRREFADRPVYLDIMHSMIDQGTVPGAPRPTRYPRWVTALISFPWDPQICSALDDSVCLPR